MINRGYKHMVDAGYGTVTSARDIVRILEIDMLWWGHEVRIGKQSGFEQTREQIAMRKQMQLQFNALKMRVGE